MSIREGKFTAPHQSQFRTSHDARIPFGVINEKTISLPSSEHAFGRPNRPQTPVAGIVSNNYGEMAGATMQSRYATMKEMQKTQTQGLSQIRMTNAQIGMNNAIREKWIEQACGDKEKREFKLKRFTQVDPRTSTKRGDQPFMSMPLKADKK